VNVGVFRNTFDWGEQLVVMNWNFYRINLWRRIERLIFKGLGIIYECIESMGWRMAMAL
jgi:hypothetical protein